jgi:DNA-binding winged helix-turn-helix (wHTH) protein/Flp pilus assembly protein TadD
MLKPADLATRPDLRLGPLTVSPSRRAVKGPAGEAHLEPRVMQVFILLLESRGRVVTRTEMFEQCWGAAMVGDDNINRAIAVIRKMLDDVAPCAFEVETIPRTGYRLVGAIHAQESAPGNASPPENGDIACPSQTNGQLCPPLRGDAVDRRAAELREQGRQALREELPDAHQQTIGLLHEAVSLAPGDADAWGLLALAWRNAVEHGPADRTAAAVAECQTAARNAIAIDPRNGNAHAAVAKLWPIFGDWLAAEQRLRAVLRIAPDNVVAISALGTLLQSVGRVTESARFSSLAADLDPMSPIYQFRKTFGLWCTGRLEEADRTIDRALRLWPRHPALWNTRALMFALTDRPHAALAMIEDGEGLPGGMPESAASNWRSSLKALETAKPADVEAAMTAIIDRLARNPSVAVNGICIATTLGDLDAAFTMADAYLLRRGPHVGALRSGPDQLPLTDQRWQMTMMLFIPAAAAMRSDPRFMALCRDMGMVDYWQASRSEPDFLANSA